MGPYRQAAVFLMFLILSMGTMAHGALAGTWSFTGSMNTARLSHTATRLSDGRVLVSGGSISETPYSPPVFETSAEIYDPALGTWSLTGSMSTARVSHTATRLSDGRVLVSGGASIGPGANLTVLASAEIYDPALGTWSFTGSMNIDRTYHTATLLSDSRVLVSGGGVALFNLAFGLTSAEIFDPLSTSVLPGFPAD